MQRVDQEPGKLSSLALGAEQLPCAGIYIGGQMRKLSPFLMPCDKVVMNQAKNCCHARIRQ